MQDYLIDDSTLRVDGVSIALERLELRDLQ